MQDAADAYPNDAVNLSKSININAKKSLSSEAHLYPIDETEDFHDPFSDLSLFLSKKIKSEVEKHGSSRQWSHKIQTDLLSRILPEFKVKFPKYRLGISAIRKVWEKVSYYYGKVHTHKEAIHTNGQLNIEFMIKENLKGFPIKSSSPHYNTAHQLAVKICECIATLDAARPRLDHITKIIWSAQKHLLTDLPTQKAKQPYEDYDTLDKFIVKTLLESTAKQPLISQKELQEEIKKKLFIFKTSKDLASSEILYQNLATLLAYKLYPTLSIHHLLSEKEKRKIQAFVEEQIEFGKLNKTLSPAAARVETSQRILALYPLAKSLPKGISQEEIRRAIYYVYCKVNHEQAPACPNIHPSILAFIQVELHFLKRKEEFSNYSTIEKFVMTTLTMAQHLPSWREDYNDELEVFIWYLYAKKENFLGEDKEFLNEELSSFIMDFPKFSFKNTLYKLIEYFKKIKGSLHRENKAEEALHWEEVEHKVYEWSIQNDMLCRWIHFDSTTPLLQLISTLWKEKGCLETTVNHVHFMQEVFKVFSQKHPRLDEEMLRIRISILYKYFWYHDLSDSDTSTLERFMKWHFQDISGVYQDKSLEDRMIILENRVSKLLPLTPFSKKYLENTSRFS
jgi:hypothetical protein